MVQFMQIVANRVIFDTDGRTMKRLVLNPEDVETKKVRLGKAAKRSIGRLTEAEQKQFVEAMAGNSKTVNTARKNANVVRTPYRKFREICDDLGLTDEVLVELIRNGVNAVRDIPVTKKVYEGGKVVKSEVQIVQVPDHSLRLKYTTLLLQAKGHLRQRVNHQHEFPQLPNPGQSLRDKKQRLLDMDDTSYSEEAVAGASC